MQGCHTTVTSRPSASTTTNDCKSDTLSVSNKEVPKVTPTFQSGTEELLQEVANKDKFTLQPGTTEKMEQPVASAENSEENPTENVHLMTLTYIVTKDETNGHGEPLRTINMLCHK